MNLNSLQACSIFQAPKKELVADQLSAYLLSDGVTLYFVYQNQQTKTYYLIGSCMVYVGTICTYMAKMECTMYSVSVSNNQKEVRPGRLPTNLFFPIASMQARTDV